MMTVTFEEWFEKLSKAPEPQPSVVPTWALKWARELGQVTKKGGRVFIGSVWVIEDRGIPVSNDGGGV